MVAADVAGDTVWIVYPVWALQLRLGLPLGASSWCGCRRELGPCSEFRFMERLLQRENVWCYVVFHTPRLSNIG